VDALLRTLAVALSLAAVLPAQIGGNGSGGSFHPVTQELVLDTTANGGVFQFSLIHVAQGVTVRFSGPNPVILLCTGTVDIDGQLQVDAGSGPYPGPGGHAGGISGSPGSAGSGPGGGSAGALPGPGGAAAHANAGTGSAPVYGAALPFDLRGGSGGGGGSFVNANDRGADGGAGGGVLAILADGPVTVSATGAITARGGSVGYAGRIGTGGPGAGGSVLLRSLQCVRVAGTIDTSGGLLGSMQGPIARGGDGFVRIDSWSACGAPDLTGATLIGQQEVHALPFLTQLDLPRRGQLWRVRCVSVPGDLLGCFASLRTAQLPLPPFGTVEIDPTAQAGFVFLGLSGVPALGVDPWAAMDLRVPQNPALVGLTIFAQAANVFRTAVPQPRLSNRLDGVVQ
jgi:hypothetical protein